MAEAYLFYSSISLLAMGCLALVLSVFFRLKSHAINNVSEDLSPSIFDKTFNVFNPYPEHIKIIHSFLLILPILVFLLAFGSILIVIQIFENGLLVSLFIIIISWNLIFVDITPEVYRNTKTFINAVQSGTSLGIGDLKVFQFLRRTLPKLSNYYLGLSIFFMALAAILNLIWPSILWILTQFIYLILEVSAATGWIGWMISLLLFVTVIVFIQMFVWKIRRTLKMFD